MGQLLLLHQCPVDVRGRYWRGDAFCTPMVKSQVSSGPESLSCDIQKHFFPLFLFLYDVRWEEYRELELPFPLVRKGSKMLSLEGNAFLMENSLGIFWNGFSLLSSGDTRKFFSHFHYENLVEPLDVKSTKMCSLSSKSGPPGVLKSYVSAQVVSSNSSVTAPMLLPVTTGLFAGSSSEVWFSVFSSHCGHFSGEGRGGGLCCDLNFLGSLRKVIGF